jgi:Spy/CpxP family protein refolding chaperone
MKKPQLMIALLLAVMLVLATSSLALAQPPIGGCPVGFELHHVGHHGDHHDHHIGLRFDLNNDGKICVNHLNNDLHVHVDNVIR